MNINVIEFDKQFNIQLNKVKEDYRKEIVDAGDNINVQYVYPANYYDYVSRFDHKLTKEQSAFKYQFIEYRGKTIYDEDECVAYVKTMDKLEESGLQW